MRGLRRILGAVALVCLAQSTAWGQLRVVEWNITNYNGGRVADLTNAIYGEFEGRSMSPDIVICQEFISSSAVSDFLDILNTAPGSPGDWAAAGFIDGPDTDNAFFYRTGKVVLTGVSLVSGGGSSPNHPRHLLRYDVRLVGYSSLGAYLSCYSSHMKAGTSGTDQTRRLDEAEAIRGNAEWIPNAFLLAGDFNMQTSLEAAYQELVGSQANNDGRFFDPIDADGTWYSNSVYKFLHTQDPVGPGGMDDRFDQILVSDDLIDGVGLEYIGDPDTPFSFTTWNDPNHSYRTWGNDGTSYNVSLRVTGNSMVGPTIAQALKNAADGAGHIPVFLDLRAPARISAETDLDFGQVSAGTTAEQILSVLNDGDVALWTTDGLADLEYSLETTAGFTTPAGPFSEAPGGAGNQHTIVMDTSTPGLKSGTLTITSDAPDNPVWTVTLSGEVVSMPGDIDGDSDVDWDDHAVFVECLAGPGETSPPVAGSCTQGQFDQFDTDLDPDGDVDLGDFAKFAELFTG